MPNFLRVDTEVIVGYDISEALDPLPRNFFVLCHNFTRESSNGFSDIDEVHQNSVENKLVSEKSVGVGDALHEFLNFFDIVDDVEKVVDVFLVIHRRLPP